MVSDEAQERGAEKESRLPSGGAPLNIEELALAAKVLSAHASVLAAAGRVTEFLAKNRAQEIANDANGSQELLQSALSIGQQVAEIQEQVQKVMQGLQGAGSGVDQLELPSPTFFRLQEGLAAVGRYRAVRLDDLAARVSALELAVTKLEDLLKDPDLPEETKEEIRKLLRDLGGAEYIK